MNEAKPLLTAEGVVVRRGGREILHQVSLTVREREIVTVVGPNGAGKTTLLNAILGLIPLAAGRVTRRPGVRLAYVPQRLQVDPVLPLSARDFLTLSAPPGDRKATPESVLERLNCPHLLARPMHSLSGGETQRVLLGRALVRQADLLVLDEPAQGVDINGEQEIYGFFETLRRDEGIAVLMVSHDLHFVMATTDRVICLNKHVCCSGTPTAVRSDPVFCSLLGEAQPVGFGLYRHHHDHMHNLCGEALEETPRPLPCRCGHETPEKGAPHG